MIVSNVSFISANQLCMHLNEFHLVRALSFRSATIGLSNSSWILSMDTQKQNAHGYKFLSQRHSTISKNPTPNSPHCQQRPQRQLDILVHSRIHRLLHAQYAVGRIRWSHETARRSRRPRALRGHVLQLAFAHADQKGPHDAQITGTVATMRLHRCQTAASQHRLQKIVGQLVDGAAQGENVVAVLASDRLQLGAHTIRGSCVRMICGRHLCLYFLCFVSSFFPTHPTVHSAIALPDRAGTTSGRADQRRQPCPAPLRPVRSATVVHAQTAAARATAPATLNCRTGTPALDRHRATCRTRRWSAVECGCGGSKRVW